MYDGYDTWTARNKYKSNGGGMFKNHGDSKRGQNQGQKNHREERDEKNLYFGQVERMYINFYENSGIRCENKRSKGKPRQRQINQITDNINEDKIVAVDDCKNVEGQRYLEAF